MHLKHRGACSELTACAWLLENGWEVFRNVSAHGLADIVATKGREFIPIDVKTVPDRPFRMRLSQVQVEAGVAALYVHRDGTCTLNLAPEVRCPRKDKK